MQINLSTNLPNTAGEAAAKSAEPGTTGSASAFFAQMDQILIPDNESSESQSAERSVVQNSSAIRNDPMSALLGATMLSLNPIKAEPASNPESFIPASVLFQESN